MERNRYINCTWWLPTAYGSTPLPPQWGSSFTETPQMLLMLWRVMACVHLHRTVALASGGLGSAEAWFIDNPGVSAATLTIQSQTNGQVDDWWKSSMLGSFLLWHSSVTFWVRASHGASIHTRDSHQIRFLWNGWLITVCVKWALKKEE